MVNNTMSFQRHKVIFTCETQEDGQPPPHVFMFSCNTHTHTPTFTSECTQRGTSIQRQAHIDLIDWLVVYMSWCSTITLVPAVLKASKIGSRLTTYNIKMLLHVFVSDNSRTVTVKGDRLDTLRTFLLKDSSTSSTTADLKTWMNTNSTLILWINLCVKNTTQ